MAASLEGDPSLASRRIGDEGVIPTSGSAGRARLQGSGPHTMVQAGVGHEDIHKPFLSKIRSKGVASHSPAARRAAPGITAVGGCWAAQAGATTASSSSRKSARPVGDRRWGDAHLSNLLFFQRKSVRWYKALHNKYSCCSCHVRLPSDLVGIVKPTVLRRFPSTSKKFKDRSHLPGTVLMCSRVRPYRKEM